MNRTEERYRLPECLPAPHSALRFCIVVPARDEAAHVGAALAAIAAQCRADDRSLPYGAVETIVFANGCGDPTAERVRAFAAATPHALVHVVEAALPRHRAHVGTARAALMDAAAERLSAVGRPDGTIATTDADSVTGARWIAETERALRDADAVGGRIFVDAATTRALDPALARALATDERYRFAVARLEARRDPLAHDTWPRHGQQFGASLAVRADVYERAGGLPAVPVLEDVAFYGALARIDARFRHSLRVRVTTSPRFDPRAGGGFGTHVAKMRALAERGRSMHVEDPELTLARVATRAALRRCFHAGPGAATAAERRLAAETFATTEAHLDDVLEAAPAFGAAFESLERAATEAGAFARAGVAIERATERLEAYARERFELRAAPRATAWRAALSKAASGFG